MNGLDEIIRLLSKEVRSGYHTREEYVRAEVPKEEAIQRIEKVYHQTYAPDSTFDAWDQLLACESIEENPEIQENNNATPNANDNPNVQWSVSVNGGSYHCVNSLLSANKLLVISKLKSCTRDTSPILTASLLEELFREYPSKPGHWLYVAQHWNPRAINWVLADMMKDLSSGRKTLKVPPAYFTFLIQHRKPRRSL